MLTGDGSWSLAELLQAIVILVHFHSACSYAIGADSPSSSAHAQTLASVSAAARSAKSISQAASSRQNIVQKTSCDSNTEFKNGVQSLINDRYEFPLPTDLACCCFYLLNFKLAFFV